MEPLESMQPLHNSRPGKTPPPPAPAPGGTTGSPTGSSTGTHTGTPTTLSPIINENPLPLSTMRVVINMEFAVTPGKTPPPPSHRIEIVVTPPTMPET